MQQLSLACITSILDRLCHCFSRSEDLSFLNKWQESSLRLRWAWANSSRASGWQARARSGPDSQIRQRMSIEPRIIQHLLSGENAILELSSMLSVWTLVIFWSYSTRSRLFQTHSSISEKTNWFKWRVDWRQKSICVFTTTNTSEVRPGQSWMFLQSKSDLALLGF